MKRTAPFRGPHSQACSGTLMTTPACSRTGKAGNWPREALQRPANPEPWPWESRISSTSFPSETYKPGDVFITNDPWALAGHLNDVCVMSPIFYKDQLAAFTACVFHHSDIGGRVSSDNHDVFEEGLFIPLVKLYDGGSAQSVRDGYDPLERSDPR